MNNKKLSGFDINKVPFVHAFDLLEKEKNKLSPEEASCLAVALFRSLGMGFNTTKSAWELNAQKEALSQRL